MKFLLFIFLALSFIAQSAEKPLNSWVGKSGKWHCNDGYELIDNGCKKLSIPENSFAVGADWFCNDGFFRFNGKCSASERADLSTSLGSNPAKGSKNDTNYAAQQILNKDRSKSISRSPSVCAENGSCYGDISSYNGKPKTVSVKGYYRKDGTYVRGHYRSK